VCCSVLQYVAVQCRVLQCATCYVPHSNREARHESQFLEFYVIHGICTIRLVQRLSCLWVFATKVRKKQRNKETNKERNKERDALSIPTERTKHPDRDNRRTAVVFDSMFNKLHEIMDTLVQKNRTHCQKK